VVGAPGIAAAVQTADCLPVLLCSIDGAVVAAAHAGWRGLAAGVLEASVGEMHVPAAKVIAWLGAAIGPKAFEVGDEVRQAFCDVDAGASECFRALGSGKWHGDLYGLARQRLARAGIRAVFGGGACTLGEPARYYSFRRGAEAGRMAAVIWLAE
jgi:YfiH family protein